MSKKRLEHFIENVPDEISLRFKKEDLFFMATLWAFYQHCNSLSETLSINFREFISFVEDTPGEGVEELIVDAVKFDLVKFYFVDAILKYEQIMDDSFLGFIQCVTDYLKELSTLLIFDYSLPFISRDEVIIELKSDDEILIDYLRWSLSNYFNINKVDITT